MKMFKFLLLFLLLQGCDQDRARYGTKAWDTSERPAIAIRFPQLKALMRANDSMAPGAVSALRQAGRDGDIRVVGFDNISAIQELVKTGVVLATADQHADLLAVYGIEYALHVLDEGGELKDRETRVDPVTRDSF